MQESRYNDPQLRKLARIPSYTYLRRIDGRIALQRHTRLSKGAYKVSTLAVLSDETEAKRAVQQLTLAAQAHFTGKAEERSKHITRSYSIE